MQTVRPLNIISWQNVSLLLLLCTACTVEAETSSSEPIAGTIVETKPLEGEVQRDRAKTQITIDNVDLKGHVKGVVSRNPVNPLNRGDRILQIDKRPFSFYKWQNLSEDSPHELVVLRKEGPIEKVMYNRCDLSKMLDEDPEAAAEYTKLIRHQENVQRTRNIINWILTH